MKRIIVGAACATLLGGCIGGGGGGGSSSVVGLQMPSTMSVVTAQDSGSVAAVQRVTAAHVAFPTGSDYGSDPAHTYVYDSSMEPLDTVNMILCVMEQTRASDMVNQGAYTALINEDKCEQGSNQSSSGQTGQSGAKVTRLNKWVIESTRTDNASPQYVKLWIPPSGGGGGGGPMDQQRILVEIEAREGVTASKPFGDFTLNFKGVVDSGLLAGGTPTGTDTTVMAGTLKTDPTNPTRFQFIEQAGEALTAGAGGGMFSRQSATDVILDDAAGTTGRAVTAFSESFNDGVNPPYSNSANFAVAFDGNYLLRDKDSSTQVCTDRNNFNTQTWRYNLYHHADGTFNGQAVSAGERVRLNSGFPFRTASNDNGHVGYWGTWLENGTLSDGDTITRFDYNSSATSDYTVHIAPGKMTRRSANTITLDKLVGEQLYYWGEDPNNPGTFGQWQVEVNPTTYAFEITGSVQFGDNGPQVTPMTAVDITPTVDGNNLWLWSDSLGGNITYVYSTTNVVSATATLTFYAEEFVYPDGSILADNAKLYCYDRCLKGGVTSAASEADLFYPTDGTQYVYTVHVSAGKLTLSDDSNGAALVDMSALDLTSLGYDWGIQSGEMVTDATGLSASNWWEIYNAPVSLRWESGMNEWNRLTTVTRNADSSLATFDKPLTFTYTHSTANDANGSASHDGKVFLLEYGGDGDLHGFPWVEDPDTQRWYSPVTLKDGTVLSDGSNEFVVKAIESEQTMKLANPLDATDVTACTTAGLSVASLGITPPSSVDGSVVILWSERPVVTDAPAVIEGELQ